MSFDLDLERYLKPYEKLQKFLKLSDAEIAISGVSETKVQGFEKKYGVRFPEDFREYLLHLCPRRDGAGDYDAMSWWNFDRFKNVPEELDSFGSISEDYKCEITDTIIAQGAAKYIFFADYAIWIWAWAICCDESENRGRVAVICGQDRFVADSFARFVDIYIEDGDGNDRLSPS